LLKNVLITDLKADHNEENLNCPELMWLTNGSEERNNNLFLHKPQEEETDLLAASVEAVTDMAAVTDTEVEMDLLSESL